MRVALSGWFWNRPATGSGQYLRRLLASLVTLEPEMELVLVAPPDHLADQAALCGVRGVPLPTRFAGAWGKVWWEQVQLPRCAKRLHADLLHIPYWASVLAVPCPTVVTVHDLIPLLLPAYRGGPGVRLYTALVSATAPHADLLLTDSEASRADIVRALQVAPDRVQAIPLAAAECFTPEPDATDARVWHDLGVEPGYVLYLGGFDVRKNLATLCAAFAHVRAALGESARLVIAGRLPVADSAFTPDPRRLLREAGVPEDAVRCTGFVSEADAPALYRGARVFGFPSRYEGFGLPPLEALSCGVPVVGSSAASLPEVVGDAGVLTAPDDVDGIAGALIQLLNDEAFYVTLRGRALRQAARFSWRSTAAATRASYAAVFSG